MQNNTIADALAAASKAQEAAEFAQFTVNNLWILVAAALVFIMHLGFATLEAGFVQRKNVVNILFKNSMIIAIGLLTYCLFGFDLMYPGDFNGYFSAGAFLSPGLEPTAEGMTAAYADYTYYSDFIFQAMFAATGATIVSGAVAERIKLVPFLIFATIFVMISYPITGAWKWGGGWLDQMGFYDFAGSTLVHSVGGWAALSGPIILGARRGKYGKDGIKPMVASNIPLATLGTFILWMGWFGFNGASQLAMGTIGDAADISRIFCNTNLAACGGVVSCVLLCQVLYGKIDVTMALNGALAGLVAITAEPLCPSPLASILIGAVGGVIVVVTVPILDKMRIDDVVGAIPVHLVAGIFGTMVVPVTNGGTSYVSQGIGVVAAGVFVTVVSSVIWLLLKFTIGIRVSEEDERVGLDKSEVGVASYPEFVN